MMKREEFERAAWQMSYEQYQKCDCSECEKANCKHRDTYRRLPKADGGLGLCKNLAGKEQ